MLLGSGVSFGPLPDACVMIEDLVCQVLDGNTFLLSDFVLEMNGEKAYEGPVSGSWHTHFYPASDGTPFRATYAFDSTCEVANCFAAIEVAENLDSITFNGEPAKALKSPGELGMFDPTKSWHDINFTRVPLTKIQVGRNVLAIEGKKVNNITGLGFHRRVPEWQEYRSTEAEDAYIIGMFTVKPASQGRYVIHPYESPAGTNLTREGYPFYCGRAAYRSVFNYSEEPAGRVYLQLTDADISCADVRINGVNCGVVRWSPYVVDITDAVKTGRNELVVDASLTLVNAFGPNRIAGIKDDACVGPYSFIQLDRFTHEYQLFDFGIGGASIHTVR